MGHVGIKGFALREYVRNDTEDLPGAYSIGTEGILWGVKGTRREDDQMLPHNSDVR
jgi:hypothetical protein